MLCIILFYRRLFVPLLYLFIYLFIYLVDRVKLYISEYNLLTLISFLLQLESCSLLSERSFRTRFMEHRRPSTVTSEVSRHIHKDHPDHDVDISEAKILTVEPRWFERGVKEAIYIRQNRPSMNRDCGRFNLLSVWTNLLRAQARGRGGPPNSQ